MAVDGIDGRLSLIVLVIVLISVVSRKGKREGEERRGKESGKEPVSVENQRADAGQDGQTCPAR